MVVFTNSSGGTGSQPFTPPLVEKMKVELAVQDWEQADDTANRVSFNKKSFFLDVNSTAIFCLFAAFLILSLTTFARLDFSDGA